MNDNLIKQAKHLLIDTELDYRGARPVLAKQLGIHPSTLANAMGDHGERPRNKEVLEKLIDLLERIKARQKAA